MFQNALTCKQLRTISHFVPKTHVLFDFTPHSRGHIQETQQDGDLVNPRSPSFHPEVRRPASVARGDTTTQAPPSDPPCPQIPSTSPKSLFHTLWQVPDTPFSHARASSAIETPASLRRHPQVHPIRRDREETCAGGIAHRYQSAMS